MTSDYWQEAYSQHYSTESIGKLLIHFDCFPVGTVQSNKDSVRVQNVINIC